MLCILEPISQQSKRMLRKRRRKGNKLHDFSLIGEIKSLKGKKDCLAKSTFCHQNEHFFFWNDLRRHPKNHSGEKSSNCNHCDFASTRANSLMKFWKLTRKKEQNLLSTSPGLNSSINISWAKNTNCRKLLMTKIVWWYCSALRWRLWLFSWSVLSKAC